MATKLGIGIITYNRKAIVLETLARVQAHTKAPYSLVVADDGSADSTAATLRASGIRCVTGVNMGIAWNKNRALFLLSSLQQCDAVILLEDDSFPIQDGWEQEWILAAERWGHANLAGKWFSGSFLQGSGTIDDPVLSKDVSGQCSVFSREALIYGGYFDSRFRGYGQEHVEHSRRLLRVGYGGSYEEVDGEVRPIYKLLWGGITTTNVHSFSNQAERDRNWLVCRELLFEQTWRAPWRDDTELAQFRAEMQAAMAPLAL
jgi:GT2 family glycosyltransferase